MQVVLLLASALLLALGSLTVFEIRAWTNWKLAVLAGEYGHRVALVVVAVAALAVRELTDTPSLVAWAALGCAVAALALLLKPTVQAARIARRLPAEFDRVFALEPERRVEAPPSSRTTAACAEGDASARGIPRTNEKPLAGARSHGSCERSGCFRVLTYFRRQPRPVPVQTHRFSADLELDFFAPTRVDGQPAPCIVVIHGGGWDSGDQRQFTPFHHALARAGFAVAAITYRLAPQHRWPAQQDDVGAALRWLKVQAGALAIDANRFVLLGRSAGAHIALTAAYRAGDPAIRGIVSLYGPADLEFAWSCGNLDKVLDSPKLMTQLMGHPYPEAAAAYREASAYFYVTKETPPTLLLHGRLDPLVWYRQSRRLAAKLAEHGVRHLHVELPWATHAFDYKIHGPGGQLTLWSVLQFARKVA